MAATSKLYNELVAVWRLSRTTFTLNSCISRFLSFPAIHLQYFLGSIFLPYTIVKKNRYLTVPSLGCLSPGVCHFFTLSWRLHKGAEWDLLLAFLRWTFAFSSVLMLYSKYIPTQRIGIRQKRWVNRLLSEADLRDGGLTNFFCVCERSTSSFRYPLAHTLSWG